LRPLRLADAEWVTNRWCEILPIPLKAHQRLLELENTESRLAIVHQYLQQHKIL
jgi:Lon protease-like protein